MDAQDKVPLRAIQARIKQLLDQSETDEYLETGDALDLLDEINLELEVLLEGSDA